LDISAAISASILITCSITIDALVWVICRSVATSESVCRPNYKCIKYRIKGYPAEVGALFTTVSSIRVSRVSIMVSVRDSIK